MKDLADKATSMAQTLQITRKSESRLGLWWSCLEELVEAAGGVVQRNPVPKQPENELCLVAQIGMAEKVLIYLEEDPATGEIAYSLDPISLAIAADGYLVH